MGLFAMEPVDAEDWAGLPAEPLERDDVREPSPHDALSVGLLDGASSVPVAIPLAEDDEPDEDESDSDPVR